MHSLSKCLSKVKNISKCTDCQVTIVLINPLLHLLLNTCITKIKITSPSREHPPILVTPPDTLMLMFSILTAPSNTPGHGVTVPGRSIRLCYR